VATQDELDDARVTAALGRLLASGTPFDQLPFLSSATQLFPESVMDALDGRYPDAASVASLETLVDDGRLSEPALSATIAGAVETGTAGLAPTFETVNLAGLRRWGAARADALFRPVVITCLTDSIGWGVGSDGVATETSGPYDPAQQALYRAQAWPVQLRRMLAQRMGQPWADDFVGVTSGWSQATRSGTTNSASIGPFGGYTIGGAGGHVLAGTAATVTIPAANVRPFTDLDIFYWGADSGVSNQTEPTVSVDGVTVHTSSAAANPGDLLKLTLTGLSDAAHEVILRGVAGGRSVYLSHVVTRRSTGFVVNRVGRPGANTTDATGGSQTGTSKTRVLKANRSDADLLIISLGANDQPQQVPLATFSANLQAQIDVQVAAGGCVLLLGAPPLAAPSAGISEQAYRDAMSDLAEANTHVAFADIRSVFGTYSDAYALGLYPTNTTVHPSRRGAGVIAQPVLDLLMLPRYA
jgi:lysophospholipase L1-like esterase